MASGTADHTVEPIGAIIMAAGAGRRMGGYPKSLLQREGEALLLRQARLLRQAGIQDAVAVLGHHVERLLPVLRQAGATPAQAAADACVDGAIQTRGLRWVINPTPDAGPGSSLRCGLSALPMHLSAVMVVLGDQPLLEAEDVAAMLAAWRARSPGIELVMPEHGGEHGGQLGHPIVFGAAVRRAVMQQAGGAGMREWRRAHASQVQSIPMLHARCTTDIDTPQDVERLRLEAGVALAWPEWLDESRQSRSIAEAYLLTGVTRTAN